MSMLDVGAQCSACHTIDFLPSTCPHCGSTFCAAHIRNHRGCVLAPIEGEKEIYNLAGPSTFERRTKCPVKGCDRLTIEAIGGLASADEVGRSSRVGDPLGEVEIARQVRCPGCGEAFCSSHRQQSQHACSGKEDYTIRNDAFLERKAKAAEIIAKNFPEHAGRIVPKPPPQKDVDRVRPPSPTRLPPSLQHASSSTSKSSSVTQPAPSAQPKAGGKSKAEKLHDIQIRKMRSLAKPLLTGSSGTRDDEKRFFEWCVGTSQHVESWKESGKIDGKMERVWVPRGTPVGKILDLLISVTKTPRLSGSDPENTLRLLCLSSLPDQPRQAILLDNAAPASSIVEGSIVCLVKGWEKPGI